VGRGFPACAEGREVEIRRARAEDAVAIAAIYAPYVRDTTISFEDDPPDAIAMAEKIATIGARYPWLVAVEDGSVLGYAYASQHRERPVYRWSVDVSVYLDPAAHGRGIGRALYTALFAQLERLGFRGAFAGIALPNDASIGLHKALGFTLVGVYHRVGYKFGAWRDVSWWERPIGDDDEPSEPLAP